jgi:nucleotide-binding universal stress UspA family protein
MKILAAHDGSACGKWAMEWLGRLPLASPSDITVLHVVDVASVRAPFVVQPVVVGNERFIREEIDRLEKRAHKTVAEAKQSLAAMKLKGKVLKKRGAIGKTILEKAPKRDGMIILGNRGLSALDRFMLGSVSMQVSLHAPCPVLIVKAPPRPIKRILFATDGSKASGKALQFLTIHMRADILKGRHGKSPIEVVAVHAMPLPNRSELKESGSRLVQGSAKKLIESGYGVVEVVGFGKPADTILKIAAKTRPDLVVTGAKGLGAIARFFLGSVSYQLAQHTTCSVLIVR